VSWKYFTGENLRAALVVIHFTVPELERRFLKRGNPEAVQSGYSGNGIARPCMVLLRPNYLSAYTR